MSVTAFDLSDLDRFAADRGNLFRRQTFDMFLEAGLE